MNLAEQAVSFIDEIIPSTGTKSNGQQLEGGVSLVGLIHPILTTSTAITFESSVDGVTWYPLMDSSGAAISVTVDPATAEHVQLDPATFAGIKWIKLVVADAQADDRVCKLAVRGV